MQIDQVRASMAGPSGHQAKAPMTDGLTDASLPSAAAALLTISKSEKKAGFTAELSRAVGQEQYCKLIHFSA